MNQIKIFKKEISIIVQEIKAFDPISIILYGGYSRDEGGIIQTSKKLLPYNDFDVLIVVNRKIKESLLIEIKEKLLKKINIKWIDFTQKTLRELSRSPKSVFTYDLKYYGKVVYGDTKIKKLIPNINPKEILKSEIDILFSTRLWAFVGCFEKKSFDDITGEEARFFKNQMSKAILSLTDAILIENKKYTTLYSEKIPQIEKHNKDLYDLAKWAYKEKLEPAFDNMKSDEVKSLYLKVINLYFEVMISLIPRTKTFSGLVNHFRFSFKENIKNMYYKIFYKRSYLKNKICMIYITYSVIDNKYFINAQKLHHKITGVNKSQTWDEIRLDLK
jgi:hypothetical protein